MIGPEERYVAIVPGVVPWLFVRGIRPILIEGVCTTTETGSLLTTYRWLSWILLGHINFKIVQRCPGYIEEDNSIPVV
jgi:hypothetical protein